MLTFSCKDLFAHGFWNTYSKVFGTVKSVYTETLLTENAIHVKYDVLQDEKDLKGMGFLINSSPEKLLVFDMGFLSISNHDRVKLLKPICTNHKGF